nr:MAG TPA: hypothetical protein [Caudoviricetes sp.]
MCMCNYPLKNKRVTHIWVTLLFFKEQANC